MSVEESLVQFSRRNENRHCADCGKADPDWAIHNFGILVCLECSGCHRHLGSHISKVLSIKLDQWDEATFNELLSNSAHPRLVLETDFVLTPETDQNVRQEYITSKYMRTQFVLPSFTKSQKSSGLTANCAGILKVDLKNGAGLKAKDLNGLSDPYVIFESGNQKMKSKVKYNTLNPEWNQTLMLNVESTDLPINITCNDKDTIGKDDLIGEATYYITAQTTSGDSREIHLSDEGGIIYVDFEFLPLT